MVPHTPNDDELQDIISTVIASKGKDGPRFDDTQAGTSFKMGVWDAAETTLLRRALAAFAAQQGLDLAHPTWLVRNGKTKRASTDPVAYIWHAMHAILPHRKFRAIADKAQSLYPVHGPDLKTGKWSHDEDERLLQLQKALGNKWTRIGEELSRKPDRCKDRYREILNGSQTQKDAWAEDEVARLVEAVVELRPSPEESDISHNPNLALFRRDSIPLDLVAKVVQTRGTNACRQKYYGSLRATLAGRETETRETSHRRAETSSPTSKEKYTKKETKVVMNPSLRPWSSRPWGGGKEDVALLSALHAMVHERGLVYDTEVPWRELLPRRSTAADAILLMQRWVDMKRHIADKDCRKGNLPGTVEALVGMLASKGKELPRWAGPGNHTRENDDRTGDDNGGAPDSNHSSKRKKEEEEKKKTTRERSDTPVARVIKKHRGGGMVPPRVDLELEGRDGEEVGDVQEAQAGLAAKVIKEKVKREKKERKDIRQQKVDRQDQGRERKRKRERDQGRDQEPEDQGRTDLERCVEHARHILQKYNKRHASMSKLFKKMGRLYSSAHQCAPTNHEMKSMLLTSGHFQIHPDHSDHLTLT